jgi:ubiquinone/menaquinone biosynthesis C-methylase UbiE
MKQPQNPAEAYENVLVKQVFKPLADEVLRIAGPDAGDDLLDVACGTGIVLRRAAQLVDDPGRMAGIDMNPAMIELARSISATEDVPAEWHEGRAEAMPFEDEAFGRVYCQQGLQFIPDKSAALREMVRVLVDGGEAVIAVWQGIEHHSYIHAMNEVAFQRTGINILSDPFSFGDIDRLAELIEDAGFPGTEIEQVSITSRSEDPERIVKMQLAGGTAAIPSLQALDDDQRSAMIEDIVSHAAPIIEEHTEDGLLTLEWHANVAVARR